MDDYVRRLYSEYPEMLTDEALQYGQTQIGIFDGWEDIFEKLLACIQQRVTDQVTNPQKDDYPLVSDVKQKFGKVRMYMARWGSVEILDLIEEFEKEAVTTCYSCGAPARITMVDGLAAPRCGRCEAEDRGSRLN